MTRKSYGQYCGLAKTLDHVGDRWTLLVVRELLLGPRRYSVIREALPGIATNLLADRLRDLEQDGVVGRSDDGMYALTEAGRELEPAIYDLVRWGGRWMHSRPRSDIFRPEWLVIALQALLPKRRPGTVELHVGGGVIHVDRTSVGVGPFVDRPDAVVEGTPEAILGIAAGQAGMSAVKVRGNRRVAQAVLGGASSARS